MSSVETAERKVNTSEMERKDNTSEVVDEQVEDSTSAEPDNVETNNYHGLHASAILVTLNTVAIGQAVGGSSQSIWLSQAVAILTTVLSPPCAQAADYWGRKWILVISALFNFAGAMITARCTSMGMAIAGQVICGVGFGSQPLMYAVVSEVVPRRARAAAQASLMCSLAIAGSIGLPVSAYLGQHYNEGFRIYYYITAGIISASGICMALLYNPLPTPLQKTLSTRQKLAQLDWIGYGLLVSGLVLFGMALTWSQNPYSWGDAHILATFILGIILFICLIVYETRFQVTGMFHHGLFQKDWNVAISLWCIFVEGMTLFASNEFFAQEVMTIWEPRPMWASMRFTITFLTQLAASMAVAVYATMTKDIRRPIFVAFFFFMLFNILMATLKVGSTLNTWGYPVFLGIGLSLCLTCLITMAQVSAPPALISIISGLMISTRSLGGSIMLPVCKALLSSRLSANLAPQVAAKVIPLGFSEQDVALFIDGLTANNATMLASIPGATPEVIAAATQGYLEANLLSYRYVWVLAACLAFIAMISAFFLRNPGNALNMHVDAPLEEDSDESPPA
ncbi:hypothetical protein SBRCBS47491_010157 [Sporothrix bragantina]|uniref:Major facilitator superfamily (MFS) profile domain-containing protein n=1 Tax=Sporothrix bragantina TaxID=671064 RepID=A0ABP0D2U6_9PEZI